MGLIFLSLFLPLIAVFGYLVIALILVIPINIRRGKCNES